MFPFDVMREISQAVAFGLLGCILDFFFWCVFMSVKECWECCYLCHRMSVCRREHGGLVAMPLADTNTDNVTLLCEIAGWRCFSFCAERRQMIRHY